MTKDMQQGGGEVCPHTNWDEGGGGYYCSKCEEFMKPYGDEANTAPPSAPVGVEDWQKQVRRIARYTGVQYGATEKCELGAPFYAFTPAELHLFAERIAALTQQPAAVALSRKYPDDGNGDDDAYNRGWNECLDALATQHQEPTT